jgi:hypothetical protein
MKRFIEGADREQSTLLPESLDDWIDDSSPVRAVDVFVDGQRSPGSGREAGTIVFPTGTIFHHGDGGECSPSGRRSNKVLYRPWKMGGRCSASALRPSMKSSVP